MLGAVGGVCRQNLAANIEQKILWASVMSPTTSQGLVLATAMAATAVLFDLLRDKYFPQNHQDPPLKSCLSSGSKKSAKESKKKKRVKFAEGVKDPKGNGELYRKGVEKKNSCGNEILEFQKLPANHAALYNGMMKDRLHKMGYSY